jgi:hypothetical protein
MAVLRVPVVDILAMWPIGCVLAVMYWLLGLKALSMVGGYVWTGRAATVVYVAVDPAGAVLGLILAVVATEWRFAMRFRLGLAVAALAVTAVIWVTVYMIRYGT